MRTVLIEATAWNAATGAPISVALAGGGSRAYTHRGRNDWRAGVVSEPKFSARIEFGENGFSGGARPEFGILEFMPSSSTALAELAALLWNEAEVEVFVGDDALAAPAWSTLIKGTVEGQSVRNGRLFLSIRDASGKLDAPVASDRFAGTGGLEGEEIARERIKRRSWGAVSNVEALPLKASSLVYEVGDPAFPLLAIEAVKDIGRAASALAVIGWQGSAAATLAALEAAAAPQGGGVAAPSIACLKWWTQPVGPLTADLRGEIGQGYVDKAANIAERVVASRSPLVISNAAAASGWRPGKAGLHVDNSSETIAQALDRLLRGSSLAWNAKADGTIRLSEFSFAAPVETVRAISASRSRAFKPLLRRRVGFRRNHREHSEGEIASALRDDKGAVLTAGATFGATVYRADGTTVAQQADFETAAGTAAAIAGQAATATNSDFGAVTGATKPQDNATAGATVGDNVRSPGGAIYTREALETNLGVAAGFAGQGALATRNIVTAPFVDLAIGGVNLLEDGSFERGLSGFTRLAPDKTTLARSTAWARTGSSSLALSITQAAPSSDLDATGLTGVSRVIATLADEPFTFSAYVKGTVGRKASLRIIRHIDGQPGFLNPATDAISTFVIPDANAHRVVVTIPARPSGGNTTAIEVRIAQGGAAEDGDVLRIDDAQIQIGDVATDFAARPYSFVNVPAIESGDIFVNSSSIMTRAAYETGLGTAAGFAGQGALATQNSLAYGSSYLSGFASLATRDDVYFGSNTIREQSGGANASLANFKTTLGTAAAIAGQGAFATISSAAFGSSLLTGFGSLAGDSSVRLGNAGKVYREDGTSRLTDSLAITSLGISSGFAGQGALATKNVAEWSADIVGSLKPESLSTAGDALNLDATFSREGLPDWNLNGLVAANHRVTLPNNSPAKYGVEVAPSALQAVGVDGFTVSPLWNAQTRSTGQIYPLGVVGGSSLFLSVNIRFLRTIAGSRPIYYRFQGDFANEAGYIGSSFGPQFTFAGEDTGWLFLESKIAVPAGARSGNVFLEIRADGFDAANFEHTFWLTNLRFAKAATGATVGATLGDDLKSSTGAVYPVAAIETIQGTAANILGQAATATNSDFTAITGSTKPENNADVTATAQRTIEPEFPVIEIKQGEAGNSGSRTVTHSARRGVSALAGGTWSLPSKSLGSGGAAIDPQSGTVTLSNIAASGSYTVRYVHSDGIATDRAVNVTYTVAGGAGAVSAKSGRATSNAGVGGTDWQTVVTLNLSSVPAGRISFGGAFGGVSFLRVLTGTGSASYEARVTVNGAVFSYVGSQPVLSNGEQSFADFSELFAGSAAVQAGSITARIEMRRTSGTGTISQTDTALEGYVIAS